MPHSDIPGSKPAGGSPGLIAAIHVLHRLLVPRHPPCALASSASRSLESTKPAGSTFSKRHLSIQTSNHCLQTQSRDARTSTESVACSTTLRFFRCISDAHSSTGRGASTWTTLRPGATTSSPVPSAEGVGIKIARRSVEPRGTRLSVSGNLCGWRLQLGDNPSPLFQFQVRTALNGSYASRECSLYPPVPQACKWWSRGDSNP